MTKRKNTHRSYHLPSVRCVSASFACGFEFDFFLRYDLDPVRSIFVLHEFDSVSASSFFFYCDSVLFLLESGAILVLDRFELVL
ncbi:hypothetical protein MtrunA17_Chr0c10g0493611 [Medicago truncatula]|uniref:Uncharacterized protein n=1 Tax=Medicago truncatula TaxID=3880 RepID=A0A396GFC9_MEDTR|nr:hypothetical protein MtrunA17_Chr0c10g0493611 [Medicago truncatula]